MTYDGPGAKISLLAGWGASWARKRFGRALLEIAIRAPSRDSPYSNVLLWVDEASGALMRLDCYDWKGQLVKRFEVVSGQKIDNRWFLKQMRIEELQPGPNKVVGAHLSGNQKVVERRLCQLPGA